MKISKSVFIALMSFALFGCDKPVFTMTAFERFAYEGCVKEGKYPNSICACNAANLDQALSDDEKQLYKKTALGNPFAGLAMLGILDKLINSLQKCAN